eukprot:TRINITY_DN4022_c0_g1_i2.p1 TRINITY_DN4022_c0_g1~~TRINITY_DN4022_c0_g1_i2.p1  ORF type:complete len:220 (-),score=32.61 TRINITY_DN4022_c0_g1_i2:189-848(-)
MILLDFLFLILTVVLSTYLILVQRFRFARRIEIESLPFDDDLVIGDKKKPSKSWKILRLTAIDQPFLIQLAMSFALFRTYGIPSIAKLLASTDRLVSKAARRLEDTDLILREIGERDPSSDRPRTALDRLNFIHGRYPIKNSDSVYTLSTFVLEPLRWIQRYGWRPLTYNEKMAFFTYWKKIGEDMNIKHIPETLEEMEEFNIKFEEEHMKYTPQSKAL